MTRQFPKHPIVAVGVVVLSGGNVLLIQRGQPPLDGHWSLPGGAQHVGETLHDAARREVREETGIDIVLGGLLDAVDYIDRDAAGNIRHHYTLIDFWARAMDDLPLTAGDDARAAAWFELDRLGELNLWEETRRVIALAYDKAQQEAAR